MNKTFIEFQDHIFALEDVICVERYYTWYGSGENKHWTSVIYLTDDNSFKFKEEHYDELKYILLNK